MSCARGTSSLSRRVTSQQGLEGEKPLRLLLSSLFFPRCSNKACVALSLGSPPPRKALSSAVLGRGPDSPAPPSLLRRDGNSPFDWAQPAQRDVLFFFSLFLMPCRAFLDLGRLFCKVFGPGFP